MKAAGVSGVIVRYFGVQGDFYYEHNLAACDAVVDACEQLDMLFTLVPELVALHRTIVAALETHAQRRSKRAKGAMWCVVSRDTAGLWFSGLVWAEDFAFGAGEGFVRERF